MFWDLNTIRKINERADKGESVTFKENYRDKVDNYDELAAAFRSLVQRYDEVITLCWGVYEEGSTEELVEYMRNLDKRSDG